MPKVELHVHLEGAIPINALWTLVEKYHGNSQVANIQELQKKFKYIDFPHFIETWVWKNQFLKEYDDFEHSAEYVAKDFVDQNICYAEMFFSPGDFVKHGLDPQELAYRIRKGLNKYSDKITINLIADLIRDFGPERGYEMLEQIAEVKDQGIIGIGIGGSEQDFPPEPYRDVYKQAKELGFRTTAHAGEHAGAVSIWGAIKQLEVDRIGHGVRAKEDPKLVEYIIEHHIPVEMCPISNVKTGAVERLEDHPIKQFLERGMAVSVNTDDPTMFNTSLEHEYLSLIKTFGFSKEELKQLVQNGVISAWCSQEQKEILLSRIDDYFSTVNL